jgi:hypothetical protein
VRGLLVSVAVALTMCGAALGAGWGVQTAVLPRAAHGSRVAADAAAWLLRYRLVESSLVTGGRRESSLCLRGWFPRRDGKLARGALLVVDGLRIADNGGGARLDGTQERVRPHVPEFLLEAAGCPGVIGARAAAAAVAGGIRVTRAFAGGEAALALHLPSKLHRLGRHRFLRDRLTLYVSPRTYRPVAVAASLGRLEGVARIRLVKATPALLARFDPPAPETPGARP